MAKRSRGTSRPGQRPATRRAARPAPRPVSLGDAVRAPGPLTTADETRAAELEAEMVAEDRANSASRLRMRARATAPGAAPGRAQSGLLAARAAEEYQYVVRDVRRIAKVGGGLVAVLAVLFVLIDVLGIIRL